MITRADIEERVREWGLSEDVVEKDYVIGWLLWGIGSSTNPFSNLGVQGRHVPEEMLH
jgi:hypothetical protein